TVSTLPVPVSKLPATLRQRENSARRRSLFTRSFYRRAKALKLLWRRWKISGISQSKLDAFLPAAVGRKVSSCNQHTTKMPTEDLTPTPTLPVHLLSTDIVCIRFEMSKKSMTHELMAVRLWQATGVAAEQQLEPDRGFA